MLLVERDPALYIKVSNRKVTEVTDSYVDGLLDAGSKEFGKLTELTLIKFDTKPKAYGTLTS